MNQKNYEYMNSAFQVHKLYHVKDVWGEDKTCVYCQKKKEFFK